MLSIVGIIAYLMAGVTTFGIAVTATVLMITCLAGFSYARFAVLHRRVATCGFALGTILLLYISTFAVFRLVRTFPCSLVPSGDPWENIVVFSFDAGAQQMARIAYYPLIAVTPGHCAYPNGEELRKLMRAFPVDRSEYYW